MNRTKYNFKRPILVLGNASDLTVENLRSQVGALAQSDARFLNAPTGATVSMIWVQDMIAPQAGESWKAVIQALDGKFYEISFSVSDQELAFIGDPKEVVRSVGYATVGNSLAVQDSNGNYRVALENASEIDQDGWALIAPFGDHPKSRVVRDESGALVQQNFIQTLDNASAADLLKSENSLFGKLKRALVGIPVYADPTGMNPHPDLSKYSPETALANSVKPSPIGVVDKIRVGARGVEGHFTLTPDGAAAVEAGAKFPSALWMLQLVETLANGAMRVRPFKLISVGLTPFPNISGVESLANAAAPATKQNQIQDMKLIAGFLLANGFALANSETPTEAMVLEQIQKVFAEKKNSDTKILTLENSVGIERRGRAEALADLAIAQGKITLADRDAKVLVLVNSKSAEEFSTEAKKLLDLPVVVLDNSFAAERKGRAEALVDLGIAQGKIAVADRDAKILVLVNSKTAADFTAEVEKLTKLPVVFKVGNATTDTKEKTGAAITKTASEQLIALANSDDRYKNLPYPDAWAKACADHPALVEQMKTAPAAK